MKLRRRRWLIAASLTLVVGVVGFVLALSVEGIRWRMGVLAMKSAGDIDELSWPEIITMLKPGSGFHLAPLLETPNPFAVIQNPFITESDRQAGEENFLIHCALCHGALGEGETAPTLVGRALKTGDSDLSLFRTVTEGRPDLGMPALALSDTEAWQIVGHVRALRSSTSHTGEFPGTESDEFPAIEVPADRIANATAEPQNWLTYSGSYKSWRYSDLAEINEENVSELKLAWALQFDTSDHIEASPIVVDGVMFLSISGGEVVAVDTSSGSVIWSFSRPLPDDLRLCCSRVNRGVAVLNDQVYIGTLDASLVALDARTGRVTWDTEVAPHDSGYSITGAPLAIEDKIIVGVAGGEFGIRGFIDGYDAETGQRLWRLYTIPEPGEPGSETWTGDAWRTGGGPTWLTGSYDPDLRLLYWGVGNPSPDYNGDFRPGDNLFTDSVLAVRIDSGELAWHFQFTPHDVHDWDSNQIPVLVDLDINAESRRVLLWANRNGFYYVLDRVSGEFLHASEFVRQSWTDGLDNAGRPILIEGSGPSEVGTLTWPGHFGGTNWWSPSFSPDTKLFYVPFIESPKIFFKDADIDLETYRQGDPFTGGVSVATGEPFQSGIRALDAASGAIAWEYLTPPRNDAGWMGGTLASAGNLVFFGDVRDFVAYHAEKGEELWRVNLGGLINASPTTFAVDGSQRVAITAGNTLYVFRL